MKMKNKLIVRIILLVLIVVIFWEPVYSILLNLNTNDPMFNTGFFFGIASMIYLVIYFTRGKDFSFTSIIKKIWSPNES